jgi:ubiquitin-like domain-containing CTD phosphatase 1
VGACWALAGLHPSPSRRDDLRRNYVLNKQQGLVIRPWRKHHRNRDKDRELVYLARYLDRIAELDSLEGLDHDRWEEYAGVGRKRKANGGDGAAP